MSKKYSMFTHKQQKKKYKQNDPMLIAVITVILYFHWQIFTTSGVLEKGVNSIKFYSSGPRLDTWVGILLQGL
jgi:predicted branched-subunit amino acid permease